MGITDLNDAQLKAVSYTDGPLLILALTFSEKAAAEMQELESNHVETYPDIEKIRDFVLGLTPAEAREIGIKYRSTLRKLKDRLREGDFKLGTKEMRKVLEKMSL
ncbi:hypothetical protein V7O66_04905 [Methanolobus sp. ZRKC3]|uniref:hypothetical protein n=1 Tax=Methanolobus sp. ZRKC3 TaxID=3125786 RepID=UPI003253343C